MSSIFGLEDKMRSTILQGSILGPAAIALSLLAMPLDGAAAYTVKTLYSFCPKGSPCSDGQEPVGRARFWISSDSPGHLFGVTLYGGATTNGTVPIRPATSSA